MIPVDITLSFIVGMSLALVVREKLRNTESIFYNKYLYITFLWTALLFMPSTMLFLYNWAAWDLMYYINPDDLNPYLAIVFPSLIVAMGLFSFMLTHHLLRKNNGKLAAFILIAVVILFCLFLLLTLDRWFFHLTKDFAAWQSAPWVFSSPEFLINLSVAGIIDMISLAYVFFRFFRKD